MFERQDVSVAEALAAATPGPDTVAALAGLDLDLLGDDERIDILAALERQIGWLQAIQQRVLAEVAASSERVALARRTMFVNAAREDVGCALRVAAGTAADRLRVATALHEQLPGTLHTLADGQITYWHARRWPMGWPGWMRSRSPASSTRS